MYPLCDGCGEEITNGYIVDMLFICNECHEMHEDETDEVERGDL